jgi:hypothetical protein
MQITIQCSLTFIVAFCHIITASTASDHWLNIMLHARRSLTGFTKLYPLLFTGACYGPFSQNVIGARRIHLPSAMAAAGSSGLRSVCAAQLLPIQVSDSDYHSNILLFFCTFFFLILCSRSTRSNDAHSESCAGLC